jgi:hypothetical protein
MPAKRHDADGTCGRLEIDAAERQRLAFCNDNDAHDAARELQRILGLCADLDEVRRRGALQRTVHARQFLRTRGAVARDADVAKCRH